MRASALIKNVAMIVALPAAVAGYVWYADSYQPRKAALEHVASQLIDPSSAQFRGVRKGRMIGYCGEINGKNRFGAYVGFKRFYGGDTYSFVEPEPPAEGEDGSATLLRKVFYEGYHNECG